MTGAIWAAVPVARLGQAKTRLSGLLSPAERAAFAQAMAQDLFDALAGCPRLARVLVVTSDRTVAGLASRHGFDQVDDDGGGPTRAIATALAHIAGNRCDGLLAMMGDLPLVRPGDIARMVPAGDPTPQVRIAPARNGIGTNAIFCAPPGAIPMVFNGTGLAVNRAQAEAAGLPIAICSNPRLALDVDWPEDLAALLELPVVTRAQKFLIELQATKPILNLGPAHALMERAP
jgi:2-phospho-L-lactate guanylyltransferase